MNTTTGRELPPAEAAPAIAAELAALYAAEHGTVSVIDRGAGIRTVSNHGAGTLTIIGEDGRAYTVTVAPKYADEHPSNPEPGVMALARRAGHPVNLAEIAAFVGLNGKAAEEAAERLVRRGDLTRVTVRSMTYYTPADAS